MMVLECGYRCKWSRPTYFLKAEKEHCSNGVRLCEKFNVRKVQLR